MGGTPSSYHEMHLDFHAWLLTDGDWDGTTYTEGTGGIRSYVESLQTEISPYSETTLYNPADSGEPFDTIPLSLSDVLSSYETYITGYETTGNEFDVHHATVKAEVEEDIDTTELDPSGSEIQTIRDGLEKRSRNQMLQSIGRLNSLFNTINAVGGSAHGIAIALEEISHEERLEEFDGRAMLELKQAKVQADTQKAQIVSRLAAMLEGHQVQGRAQLLQATASADQLYIDAKRQYVNDDMQVRIKDAFWEFELYKFGEQGLGAISGASVIPADPGNILRAVSAVSGAAQAGSSLVSPAIGAISSLVPLIASL